MSKLILEVIAAKGQPAPEIANLTSAMPGTFQMNVSFAGAVVRMSRVVLINPRSGDPVECLQLEANGTVQTIIPEEFQADFAPKKRRGGKKKAAAVPNGAATSRVTGPGAAGSSRRRTGDALAAFRDLQGQTTAHADTDVVGGPGGMVVGSVSFAPSLPAGTELAPEPEKPRWGILGGLRS